MSVKRMNFLGLVLLLLIGGLASFALHNYKQTWQRVMRERADARNKPVFIEVALPPAPPEVRYVPPAPIILPFY